MIGDGSKKCGEISEKFIDLVEVSFTEHLI
jgi:hypothetical protein